MKYVPPSVGRTAFNCPYCDVLTTQTWHSLVADVRNSPPSAGLSETLHLQTRKQIVKNGYILKKEFGNFFASRCFECNQISVWIGDKMVHPQRGKVSPANPDLPDDIRRDYDEASSILDLSPRGAAALLRLALEKLFFEKLDLPGKDINGAIGKLVEKGLDERIKQALDSVRVMGNKAVHPGQIDLRDDRKTAESLFGLLNLIVDKMISEPKRIEEVYEKLPTEAINGIKRRDGRL